jgi:peptidoglycan/LPS O-acetylase OafA/YrhL
MLSLRLENPAPLAPGVRIREVDELKGWAMLMVLVYHTGGMFGLSNWLHGEVGVDVFLILSGFTLARGSRDISWQEFLKRRLLRIFPAYWMALALFLGLSVYYYGVHRSNANIVLHILGLHDFGAREFFSDINDSFWFISLILMLYVVFLPLRKKIDDLATLFGIGLLLTAFFLLFYIDLNHPGGIGHFAVRIPSFFIGIVAARFTSAKEITITLNPVLVAGLLVLAYLGCVRGIIPFYPVAGVAAIALFLQLRQSLVKHPDGRFLLSAMALMGVYSYEIFLFHQPLVRDYNRLFWNRTYSIVDPKPWQLAIGVVGALLLTFAISFVVHQLTNRLFSQRKPAPVSVPA